MATRRRPGQRAVLKPTGYDLDADRSIRAARRFKGVSLGEAVGQAKPPRLPEPMGESFIAKDRIHLVPNEERSDVELLLALDMEDVELFDNPQLEKRMKMAIKSEAVDVVREQMQRAKRARHTANVVAYARQLASAPTMTRLDVATLESSRLPF
ncbi:MULTISPECIES: hypothetical protein [unclassified Caballeronia]|uniref:hypothetical protein n=1 Tax=unclassified Caballeronia TaxID=2646786 RepID=UPI002860B2F5|nr:MULTISPECIES: hypothetical protein [unclassified Caballeronia]MDR5771803.1 hypothetical protein [Caballeronia sp. LZ002]MDR5847238.1 hypothetical protein [Caballeronia sp. LZ003]